MLNKLRKTNKKGFTIIEVMIVLAIAGLILLIVFLAIPALQRNARNTQRKNDVASLISAFNEYVDNNNGTLPTVAQFVNVTNNWKPGYYTTPANIKYTYNANAPGNVADPGSVDKIVVTSYATCNGTAGATGTSSRNVAITYDVEVGGGTSAGTEQCVTAD